LVEANASSEAFESSAEEAPRAPSPASIEPAPRRFDQEIIAVPMDADQELVFGWMGLNPALLLDQPPSADNVVVRVVRPGLDAELVLEEARQQLAASGTRRRRGRGGRGGAGLTSHEQSGEEPGAEAPVQIRSQRDLPAMVEITPLPEAHQPETVVTVSVPTVVSIAPPEVELPARRGRTRSSAASNGSKPAAAKATLAVVEPELDEAGEPRRRRRRSSAPT